MAFNPALDGHKINMRSEYADTVTRKWTRTEVDNIMQMLVFDSNSSALAFEAMTLDAVDAEWMGDMMVLDSAVITTNMRTLNGKFTESISRTLTRKLSPDLSISGNEVGKVKKSGLYASIAAIFHVSDGQTVTIIFHAPDGDPKVIAQDDTLIAFRVLMNKTDITSHVLPQLISTKGVTSLDQVSTNIASLIKANSETFKGKQSKIADQKKELEVKTAELRKLEAAQVEAVQMEADAEQRMKDADEKGAGLESRIRRVEEDNAVLQEKIDKLKAKKNDDRTKMTDTSPKPQPEAVPASETAAPEKIHEVRESQKMNATIRAVISAIEAKNRKVETQEIGADGNTYIETDNRYGDYAEVIIYKNGLLDVAFGRGTIANAIKAVGKQQSDLKSKDDSYASRIKSLRTMPLKEYETAMDSLIAELEDAGKLADYEAVLTEIDKARDEDLKKLVEGA